MSPPALVGPPPPRLGPGEEADELARRAYAALLADVGALTADGWARPTECEGWSVRDMVAHLVGAAQGHASMRVFTRQYAWGVWHKRRFGGSSLDAMNHWQIDSLRDVPDTDLPGLLSGLAPRAVAGRARLARLTGWVPLHLDAAGSWYEGMPTRTTVAQLCSVVLTRDVWAHRLDLARSLGRAPATDAATDGRVVADIVAEWAERHAQPFELELTGPAGGAFRSESSARSDGPAGGRLTLDAVDFGRLMAGRHTEGPVPASPLWSTKVLF